MKKLIAGLAAVAIIAAVIVAVVAGRNNNKSTTPTSNQTGSSSSGYSNTNGSSSSASQTPTSTNKVTISNFAFSPATITVKKSTTVTWTNSDSVPHQPVADSGTGPASQPLNNGQTYSFTYSSVGTFAYHCAIHPEMHGTVTVTE